MPDQHPVYTLSRRDLDAVIFDLDGVVTRTADIHAAAWKRLFDDYLKEHSNRGNGPFREFDIDQDYRRYLDGKPRYDGVADFLKSRGKELAWGSPDDPADRETVCGLGNRKNDFFQSELREHGVKAFDSTVALIRVLRERGFGVGIISSSKNCRPVLEAAGLLDLFDVMVDGVLSAELDLPGKPEPDIFIEAAKRLKVVPRLAAVVEDAISGVRAGRAGGSSDSAPAATSYWC